MTTILVPLDGSKLAEEVLPFAQDLAKKLSATVRFIEVVDMPAPALGGRSYEDTGMMLHPTEEESVRKKQTAEDYLQGISNMWRAQDINSDWEVVEGKPATRIVEAARAHQANMIAMCTHGRSGLAQLVFGSVANEVLREAGIPVLLVRPGAR